MVWGNNRRYKSLFLSSKRSILLIYFPHWLFSVKRNFPGYVCFLLTLLVRHITERLVMHEERVGCDGETQTSSRIRLYSQSPPRTDWRDTRSPCWEGLGVPPESWLFSSSVLSAHLSHASPAACRSKCVQSSFYNPVFIFHPGFPTYCMTTSRAWPRDTGLLLRKLKSSWWLR